MIYKFIKYFFDKLLAFFLIIILMPLLVLISITISLDSKGPIFFIQKRIGFKGKTFNIFKFRTMFPNSEKRGVTSNKNDLRVTKVGKFLRKFSIDEIPQLFNVFFGDMSFVGPRPPLTYYPLEYSDYPTEYLLRFTVKPGITGLAQINGRKSITWEKKFIYDLQYVRNISFFLDLKIIIITIFKVILAKDVYNE